MEGVCLGKCIPKGDVARKLNHEESEEIHLLREQVRDLSEMNLALRRELQAMQVHRERRISTSSWESSEADIEIDEDVVDPSQVHPRTGRVSVRAGRASVREEEDDEGLLEEEPVSPNAINLKADNDDGDGVKRAELAAAGLNGETAKSSALGKARPLRFCIFTVAFLFVIFVLTASSTSLGAISEGLYGDQLEAMRAAESHGAHDDHADKHSTEHATGDHSEHSMDAHTEHADATEHSDHSDHLDHSEHSTEASVHVTEPSDTHQTSHGAHRRRLGGGVSVLLQNIAYCLTTCGLVAFFVGLCKQPLILGYLLGGVVVGPNLGLDLVHSHENVAEIANLGLVFLLFMIGLELDVHEILRMGRVVLLTGLFQFPVCFGAQYLIFTGLNALGLSMGAGDSAVMYCALVCAISSTMIVVKMLSEKGETERPNGRLTVGILIFQDIWAMVFLAIQPNLANPDLLTLCKQFGMIAALIVLALGYAKFVMPAVLFFASRSVELMLVLSLSWCFFMGVTAHLPWVGVGMELAALIAGVALATFPYSAEFNGKIKYIRDFFITLFFAALGMQIPVPSLKPILTALLISIFVLIFRWLGIFSLVYMLGGSARLGILATLNLSQISEFALVICSLGMSYGHIDETTLEIIIWVFMVLSIFSSNLMTYNHQIFRSLAWLSRKVLKHRGIADSDDHPTHDEDERDILLLGFHRIASMMVAEFEQHAPKLLRKLQVVEWNQHIKEPLLRRGIKFSYGDFSSADVLEHCFHGEPKIIISTTPDTMLQGTTNMRILKVAMGVWPKAHVIVTADNPQQAADLYQAGAHYVLRSAKLCAERLFELLNKYETDAGMSDLQRRFDKFKKKENDQLQRFIALKV